MTKENKLKSISEPVPNQKP